MDEKTLARAYRPVDAPLPIDDELKACFLWLMSQELLFDELMEGVAEGRFDSSLLQTLEMIDRVEALHRRLIDDQG